MAAQVVLDMMAVDIVLEVEEGALRYLMAVHCLLYAIETGDRVVICENALDLAAQRPLCFCTSSGDYESSGHERQVKVRRLPTGSQRTQAMLGLETISFALGVQQADLLVRCVSSIHLSEEGRLDLGTWRETKADQQGPRAQSKQQRELLQEIKSMNVEDKVDQGRSCPDAHANAMRLGATRRKRGKGGIPGAA